MATRGHIAIKENGKYKRIYIEQPIGVVPESCNYEFDEEVEYTIVGSAEADPMNFKISNESPVGKGLIGKKIGEIVEIPVPDGVSKLEILDIRRV